MILRRLSSSYTFALLAMLLLVANAWGSNISSTKVNLVKAGISLKITNFITWPNENPSCSNLTHFPIVILGQSGLANHFKDLAPLNTVHKKSISFNTINNINMIPSCGMVILGTGFEKSIHEIIEIAKQKATLIVSDQENYGKQGILITLFVVDGKPKIATNMDTLQKSKLKFSYKLLNLSKKIHNSSSRTK